MRCAAKWMLVLCLCAASPAMAQTQMARLNAEEAGKSAATAKKGPSYAAAREMASAAPAAAAPAAKAAGSIEAELLALRQLLEAQARELEATRAALKAQQEKMDALERSLNAQPAAGASVAAAEPQNNGEKVELLEGQVEAIAESLSDVQQRVTKVTGDLSTAQRNYDGKLRQLGNFRFSGDLRFRYEPFLQDQQTTRQRTRVRARLNITGNLTDELYGGVSLATGTLDDPISTNQTLTGFFNRKNIGFDRLFLEYTPKVLKNHVRFGLGKFAFPWVRTTLTFDSDMNPEGIYSRVNWDYAKNPVFKGWTLVTFWLPFNEVGGSTSATSGVRANGYDNFIVGGQLQTRWQTGSRLRWGLNIAGINFVNPDPIAVAHATGGLTGNAPNTARLRTNTAGTVVGYASKYAYLDFLLTSAVNTGYAKWPLNLQFNFVNNVRATNRVQNGTAGITATLPNRERSAFFVDAQLGRLSERKDIQFGWQFYRIERDAIVTAFNESDLRAGSNVVQHRLNFSYQWLNNVSLNYAIWIGRLANAQDNIGLVPGGKRAIVGGPCNVAPFSGCTDNLLKRMQFDLIYRF